MTYIDTVESAQLSNGTLRVTVTGRFYDMSSKEFVRTGYEVHLSRVSAGKKRKIETPGYQCIIYYCSIVSILRYIET